MEYPDMQSAFQVFASKSTKKKKTKKKIESPKSLAYPEGGEQVSPLRCMSCKAKRKEKKDRVENTKKRSKNSVADDALKLKLKENVNGDIDETFGDESIFEVTDNDIENGDIKMLNSETKKKRKRYNETNGSNNTTPVVKLKKSKGVLGKSLKKKKVLKEVKEVKVQKKKKRKKTEEEDGEDREKSPSTAADSVEEGERLFAWLIDPVTPEDFFRDTWEQRPLMINRRQPDFYQTLVSTETIHKMLERDYLQFGKNVDVTSYRDGKRETHNPEGRAFPAVVWSHYSAGCSVRLLNPQTFVPKLHLLNATLQEYFGCLVGANAYLTPPNSQGFAPHYDDIEAFILQLEGQKAWKLYAPRTQEEVLARFSSDNLTTEEVGEPIMEVLLNPGDLLYFPRGTIHQARTVPASHSLHVTLSCYQRNTWGDLLEKAVPVALKYALEEDAELRRGLPRDYLGYMGTVHSDQELPTRQAFMKQLRGLVDRVFQHLPVDAAVDQMGKQFMHDALPPVLTTAEKQCSVFGDGLKMLASGKLCNHAELELNTRIRLLRAHVLRLVVEDEDVVKLYHYVDNSPEYHGHEPQFLEVSVEAAPAVELLIHSYPAFLTISSLPLGTTNQKVELASKLWKAGLLLTDGPLNK